MTLNNMHTAEAGWLCPLYAFRCYNENVEIVNGISVVKAPTELCLHISQQTEHLYGLWEDPSKFDYAIYIPNPKRDIPNLMPSLGENGGLEQIKRGLREQDDIQDSLFDLITAMRLCHAGYVHIGPIISCQHHSPKWSVGGTTIWASVSEKNFVIRDPKYYLGISNVNMIKSLLLKMQDLRKKKALDVFRTTLTRFHSSYTGSIEDRIIDQMIAFESLFLDGSGESTYKLAMRVSFLLGKGDKRGVIFEDVKNAYKIRSRIVHGNKPSNQNELRPVVLRMGTYLRQSIKKFIQLISSGRNLKDVKKDLLDKYILE